MSRPPASLRLYGLAAAAVSPLAPLILRSRARRGKEDPARLAERLGHPGLARPRGQVAWLHGASVGEGLSLLPLVEGLIAARPGLNLLITSGTCTAAEILGARLPKGAIHQYAPVDTPAAARRFIDHWRPDLGVLVESELWPNLIAAARRSGARMALVSARMSERSALSWRRAPGAARAVLGAFDLILPRDEEAADRFRILGARTAGLWDAKLGAPPLAADATALRRLKTALGERPAVLAASTHPGEEGPIARAFAAVAPPDALLVVGPRHPARGAEVQAVLAAAGLTAVRRSQGRPLAAARALVADTLGEFGLFYRLAGAALIGGSLVAGVGGHNPLEPARLGRPFAAGPHTEAWPVYETFVDAGAARRLAAGEGLERFFAEALAGDPTLAAMGERAAQAAARLDRANGDLAPRLLALLDR